MKKIILVTGTFCTGQGGVASYAHDFINALKDKYIISVITGDNYLKDSKDCFSVHNFNLNKISKIEALNLLNFINKENPNFIINSNANLLSCIVPFISKEIVIISVSHFVNGTLAKIAGLNSKYINRIIALSNFGKSYIEKEYNIKDNSKVSVIYNYIPQKPNFVNEKRKREVLKIVYPGGTQYFKGADIVCEALLFLLNTSLKFEFYWLGGPEVTRHKLHFLKFTDLRNILPKDTRIKHIGKTDRINSIQLISEANVFLLPSRGEGCPISLLEAISHGTIPIISNDKHGSLEIIKDQISGIIIAERNGKLLSNYLKDIIENHSSYLRIYENSKNQFENFLSEAIWKSKMQDILDYQYKITERLNFSSWEFFKSIWLLKIILIKEFFLSRFLMVKLISIFCIIYYKKKLKLY